jgi:hypothetical protein
VAERVKVERVKAERVKVDKVNQVVGPLKTNKKLRKAKYLNQL